MGNHMIDMCQKDIHIIEYEFVRQELYSFWHALITLSNSVVSSLSSCAEPPLAYAVEANSAV